MPGAARAEIRAWVRRGATRAEYDRRIVKITKQRCYPCHGGHNPHMPNLRGFDNLSVMANLDTGMGLFTLARVSHIHLFVVTFIFFIVSLIFCHAYIRPLWLKYTMIATPFVCLLFGMSGWYMTKVYPGFAWVVMITGIVMGLAFAAALFISLYQLWFYRPPAEVVERDEAVP